MFKKISYFALFTCAIVAAYVIPTVAMARAFVRVFNDTSQVIRVTYFGKPPTDIAPHSQYDFLSTDYSAEFMYFAMHYWDPEKNAHVVMNGCPNGFILMNDSLVARVKQDAPDQAPYCEK